MSITAPFSKYKRNNYLIGITICIVCTLWFAYDGYYNEDFISENTNSDGTFNSTLEFNRKSPPFFAAAGIILGISLAVVRKKKIVADQKGLTINNKTNVPYKSIEKIDKTYFEQKGYFVITYTCPPGNKADIKISDKVYDNLEEILDKAVSEIS